MTKREFDAERALEEGAVTISGREVEVIRIDLERPYPVLGIMGGLEQTAMQWALDGTPRHGGSWSLRRLKNKPCRETVSRYLRKSISGTFYFDHIERKNLVYPHRIDITLEDGEPVDATIVDLREGE